MSSTTDNVRLDEFLRAYLECALWSSTDNADDTGGEPLDANYDADDIAPESLERMRADCAAFLETENENIEASGTTLAQAGHDFWLTRNRHGAGFWDRYNGKDEDILRAYRLLTECSHAYGSVDLYIGDDGLIYCG